MLNLTDKQIKIIKPYIDKIYEYIEKDRIGDLLLELDDVIIEYGMDDKQDELTEKGVELQKIYNQIYNQN